MVLTLAALPGCTCEGRWGSLGDLATDTGTDGGSGGNEGGSSEPGSVLWTRTFDGGRIERGRGIAVDGADNVIVVGQVEAGQANDIWVRKYDSEGTELWTRTYDGGSNDNGSGVATDSEDNVLVVGETKNGFWMRKYDPSGTELWTRIDDTAYFRRTSRLVFVVSAPPHAQYHNA